MNSKINKTEILLLVLLVCVGIVLRMLLEDYPNVSPVAALALLAGYLLGGRLLAVTVPLAVLIASDLYFGGYAPIVMFAVYTLLALPVVAGKPLRKIARNNKSPALTVLLVGISGFGFSILFYLGTNLAVWGSSSFYSRDIIGLLECYTAALPFFRQTILGDMLFIGLFFGSYAICKVWLASKVDQLVAELDVQ
ncbi:MAG: hypothetical protein CMJ76_09630 [Planctomycetaceae bacterium]|nr:hypothetical protein [Planctomycetaceae bacterium]|tara:strand:+ start:515 stop:1096 length:582 start_codon:yes stop_codon:yes gene_type:complete